MSKTIINNCINKKTPKTNNLYLLESHIRISNDDKYHWDAYYADNITFWMDVKVIFMTAYSVIASKNINTN